MMVNRLDYDVFLNLTSYLSVETDYIAWYPMLKIIEYLSPFLPYKESAPLKVNSQKSRVNILPLDIKTGKQSLLLWKKLLNSNLEIDVILAISRITC